MRNHFKILALIAAAVMLISGCDKTTGPDSAEVTADSAVQAETVKNQAYSTGPMVTVGGETVTIDGTNGFADPSLGFGMVYSDTLKRLMPDNFGLALMGTSTVMAMYVPDEVIGIVSDPMANEADIQAAYARYYQCFAIVRVTDEIGDEGTGLLPQLRKIYVHEETTAEIDGAKYVYFYNDTYDDESLSDSERKDVAALCAEMAGLKSNIVAFAPEKSDGVSFDSFTTTTLTGETVTQDIFAKNKVTMVNIWATWCNPCLEELPAIQDMMDELPEGTDVISICLDANSDMELALDIVDTYGLSFKVLMPSDDIQNDILRYVDAVPATYFIGSSGSIIGQPIVGAPVDPKAMYTQRLEEIVSALEG